MKLLLDTHVLLWAAEQSHHLSSAARALLEDERNELLFSAASLWEIAIKHALGRPDFRVEPRLLRRLLLDNGYLELAITSADAVAISTLPPIHKDPFDRLLLAQSATQAVLLVTADARLAKYPCPVKLV